ncbi:MAG: Glu/Leu/Phe/Val dehydrogenase dimerization domain-containing protein [Solirubrobacterales bacterium]
MSAATAAPLHDALGWGHERVEIVHDRESELRAVIAIHSTVLGPALGGMRIRAYDGGVGAALDDALRLSRAMTLKAAAAGLDLGGGKAVVLDDGREQLRRPRLAALAGEIERLGGAYITAEDVGTTTADMDLVASHTEHVVGRSPVAGRGGDPSPDTAATVRGAIETALEALCGDGSLRGREVGVIGLGKVGGQLAEWLLEGGAAVAAFDPVEATRERMAARGVELVADPAELFERRLDVLSPCAVGGMVDEALAARLRCRVVCGAANNPLTGIAAAERLQRRGVLYVPDFMANCGGLIRADCERRADPDPARLAAALEAARERTAAVLAEALAADRSPHPVAEEHALERLAAAEATVSGY